MLSIALRVSILADNALCYQSCVDFRFSLITFCVISRASISDSAAGAGAARAGAGAAAGAGTGGGAAGFA